MSISPAVNITPAPDHLPLFFSPASLDPVPSHDVQPSFLTPLYFLHHTLPAPLSLHSHLHAVLHHLTQQATSPSLSFSPPTVTSTLESFAAHLSTRLLLRHSPRHSLSSFLHPLLDGLSSALASRPTPLGWQWVEEFAVAYTAHIVSRTLAACIVDSAVPSTAALSLTAGAAHRWLQAVHTASLLPDTRSTGMASNLPLVTRLLLAPLHSLHFLLLSPAPHPPDLDRSGPLWTAIVDAFHVSSSPSHTTGESTCATAFQYCLSTVISQWLFHSCTPPHLLPPSSPFPTASAVAPHLTALSKALPPHQLVVVLTDLVLMLFADTSTFSPTYLPLPTLPPSPAAGTSISGVAVVCHCLHVVLSASGQPVHSLLDRLLQPDGSLTGASVEAARVDATLSFLSSMIVSGQSSTYSTALQMYLHQLMTAGSALAVAVLSSISPRLYSPRMPLFEPTIAACRRWKEQRERDPRLMAGRDGAVDGQLLKLIVDMAHTHRTITSMMAVTPAEDGSPPSPPLLLSLFTPGSARASWLAVVSLYASSPTPCIRALSLRCRSSPSFRTAWLDLLRFSLNASLFRTFLPLPSPSSASDFCSLSSPMSSSSTSPYHSLSSFLNTWMHLRLPGADVVAATLEPLPSSLSSLLPAVSTSSTYVPGAQLRSLLSAYLHSPTSRAPSSSFAPPNVAALCSAVLTYLAASSSPFASCFTVISALTAAALALPLPMMAALISRWLKQRLREASSGDEMRRWSAGKGIILALLLLEELQVDWDEVWDAELSDELIAQLLRHSSSLCTRHRKQPSTRTPPLPPLLSLLDFLLSTPPQARHWLPQVMRPSSSTYSSASTPALLRSTKLLQLLSAVFLSSPASPLSAQALVDSTAPPQWVELLHRWTERVRKLQGAATPSQHALGCCCDLEERLMDDGEAELAAALLSEQAAEAGAVVPPAVPTSRQRERQKPRANGRLVQKQPPRGSARFSRADSAHAPAVDDDSAPDAAAQAELLHCPQQSMPNGLSGSKQPPHQLGERAPTPLALLIQHDRTAGQQEADSLTFFLSAPAHPLISTCRHLLGSGGSSCQSLALPPFPRWLRWTVVGSFSSPMVVERVHAFVVAQYGPLLSVDRLVTAAFIVAVETVERRRRAGLCPFLSPDLPPLLDRLVVSLAQQRTVPPSLCLLHTLLRLLSSGSSTSSVEDVLRAVSRLQTVAWPSPGASPAPLLRRLLPLVSSSAFITIWLLQCAALRWERTSKAVHTSLLCARQPLLELWGGRHQEQATGALRETASDFLQQLERWGMEKLPAEPLLRSSPEGPVQSADAQSEERGHDEEEEAPWVWEQSGRVGGWSFEVEWARLCDDDLNLQLSHKAERERKGQRRALQQPQPLPVDEPWQLSATEPSSVEPHVGTSEAHTQTEEADKTPSPAAAVPAEEGSVLDLTSLLLPSFMLPPPPAASIRNVVAIEHSPSPAAAHTECADLFHLPDAVLGSPPLHGFVLQAEVVAGSAPPSSSSPSSHPSLLALERPSSSMLASPTATRDSVAPLLHPDPSPAVPSVAFTPVPVQRQPSPLSPPPPLLPPPASLSPLSTSPQPGSQSRPPSHAPPFHYTTLPSPSWSSSPPSSVSFSHLRPSSAITVKRSQTTLLAPLVVDVAAGGHPHSSSSSSHPFASSSASLGANQHSLAQAPWLHHRQVQYPQLIVADHEAKRRRVT